MKLIRLCLLGFPLISANVIWGDPQARPDLNGVWRFEPTRSELHTHALSEFTWQIEQSDNAIRLIQRSSGRKDADELRCGIDGKDCHVKDDGHPAVVSFYYNGSVLVEVESEGHNRDIVTKKRISVSQDGSLLTVELIHVLPEGRPPEKLVLKRLPSSSAH